MFTSHEERVVEPTSVSPDGLVYDYVIPTLSSDYIYNIKFHTHPLLIERTGEIDHYRLTAADVDYTQLLVGSSPVSTMPNYNRDEPVTHYSKMSGIWTADIDPTPGDPIAVGLLNGDITIRIVFWRRPVAPFWLTYTRANAAVGLRIQHQPRSRDLVPPVHIQVRAYDGTPLIYQYGTLRTRTWL